MSNKIMGNKVARPASMGRPVRAAFTPWPHGVQRSARGGAQPIGILLGCSDVRRDKQLYETYFKRELDLRYCDSISQVHLFPTHPCE